MNSEVLRPSNEGSLLWKEVPDLVSVDEGSLPQRLRSLPWESGEVGRYVEAGVVWGRVPE